MQFQKISISTPAGKAGRGGEGGCGGGRGEVKLFIKESFEPNLEFPGH